MSGGKIMEDPYIVDDITKEEERDIYRAAADAIYKIFGKERFLQFFALNDSDPYNEFSFMIAEKASEVDPNAFICDESYSILLPDSNMPDEDLKPDAK